MFITGVDVSVKVERTVFAGEPIAKHPKKEMAHFNDHDFLSAKPELRSKHAFDAWQDPSVFKRHPSKKAHTLSKQIIVNDTRISQRAVLDTVEANEEHFTPARCLQLGRPIAYSLNKKNRWNLSTQDLIKNKNSNNDVTFSCAKELVRWDGEGFTNPRANAYATAGTDGTIINRQARSQRNAAPLRSLALPPQPPKKQEKSHQKDAKSMEEIEQPPQMPKVEVRYVITQPHPSEEFSRMKANKAVGKAIGKKISRNRYYGATVDDFIYDADDRDVHHDDEIAAFRAPMKPITTLNDYLPNEDEFNWVVVGSKRNRKAKKQRQAAPTVAEKENDSFEVDYDTANNKTDKTAFPSLQQLPPNWDRFPLQFTVRVNTKKWRDFVFEKQAGQLKDCGHVGFNFCWLAEPRQFAVHFSANLPKRPPQAIAIFENLGIAFKITVQCNATDETIRLELQHKFSDRTNRRDALQYYIEILLQRLLRRANEAPKFLEHQQNLPYFLLHNSITLPYSDSLSQNRNNTTPECIPINKYRDRCTKCELKLSDCACWLQCHGPFCQNCMQTQFSRNTQADWTELQCPDENCTNLVPLHVLPTFLPLPTISWYRSRLSDRSSQCVQCDNCNATLILRNRLPSNTTCICYVCNFTSCYQCGALPHWPLSCTEYKRWMREFKEPEDLLQLSRVWWYNRPPYPSSPYIMGSTDGSSPIQVENNQIEDNVVWGKSTLPMPPCGQQQARCRQFRLKHQQIYIDQWTTKLYLLEMVGVWLRYNSYAGGCGPLGRLLRQLAESPHRHAGPVSEAIVTEIIRLLTSGSPKRL